MLKNEQVLEVQRAALDAGLDRSSLLAGLPQSFVASLSQGLTPAAQLLLDLNTMSAAGALADGTVPLRIWLQNARHLAALRREATIFQRALDALGLGEQDGHANGIAPIPTPYDEERLRLSEQLNRVRTRKNALQGVGEETAELDAEILAARRRLREGGQLMAGDLLGGRYLLIREAGRGGFAVVWEALDRERQERVAVKVLHGSLAGNVVHLERFVRGARAMSELSHEGIVRVVAPTGQDHGHHYFVMEFLAKGDMRRAVLGKKLAPSGLLSAILCVGDALSAAHEKGLVHRDVKPANILFDEQWMAHLADFDLVGGVDTTGGTRTGALGTWIYAAPENMERPQEADARGDVYGLAMTAIFGLLGEELPPEMMRSPDRVIDELGCNAAIKAVLKRGIEWKRDARYADAGAFCDALRTAYDVVRIAAERRPVTLLVCHLASRSEDIDDEENEELASLMANAQHRCVQQISSFGAEIVSVADGNIVAAFGIPSAREDDSVRAVRAGLAVTADLSAPSALAQSEIWANILIHTDTLTQDHSRGHAGSLVLYGKLRMLHACLRAVAMPGVALVTTATYQRVHDYFHTLPAPSREDVGLLGSGLRQVISELPIRSRFERTMRSGLTPLCGRAENVAWLASHWEKARNGHGQVVLLSGEAGIGKSRLVQELCEVLRPDEAERLVWQCWPLLRDTPLGAVAAWLPSRFGIPRETSPPERLVCLESALTELGPAHVAHLRQFASLLAIPIADRARPVPNPRRERAEILAALRQLAIRLAAHRPLLAIAEDIHWADATTIEFLTTLCAEIANCPVLLLVTFRPEATLPVAPASHVHRLQVENLPPNTAADLVSLLFGEFMPPPGIAEEIVSRADGVPLFIEELARMFITNERLHSGEKGVALSDIPSTLGELLTARLDALGAEKELAQEASVIGRQFTRATLAAISQQNPAVLHSALGRLFDARLVRPLDVDGEAWEFQHGLVQAAAYDSVVRQRLRELHKRVAAFLEEDATRGYFTAPEILAHHHGAAGDSAVAIRYWMAAGRAAEGRWANAEALTHMRQALLLIHELPDSPERSEMELKIQLRLGSLHMATQGYAVVEAENAYARAYELCELLKAAPSVGDAQLGLWIVFYARAQYSKALRLAETARLLSETTGDASMQAAGALALGMTFMCQGDLRESLRWYERAKELSSDSPSGGVEPSQRIGTDVLVAALAGVSWVYWMLGRSETAIASGQSALRRAREIGDPHALTWALAHFATILHFEGQVDTALIHAQEALDMAESRRLGVWRGWVSIVQGWAMVQQGAVNGGIERLRTACQGRSPGIRSGHSYYLATLAEACIAHGRLDEASAVLDSANAFVEETGERLYCVELARLSGELEFARGFPAAAETHLRGAHSLGMAQGSLALVRKSAASLARLLGPVAT